MSWPSFLIKKRAWPTLFCFVSSSPFPSNSEGYCPFICLVRESFSILSNCWALVLSSTSLLISCPNFFLTLSCCCLLIIYSYLTISWSSLNLIDVWTSLASLTFDDSCLPRYWEITAILFFLVNSWLCLSLAWAWEYVLSLCKSSTSSLYISFPILFRPTSIALIEQYFAHSYLQFSSLMAENSYNNVPWVK